MRIYIYLKNIHILSNFDNIFEVFDIQIEKKTRFFSNILKTFWGLKIITFFSSSLKKNQFF